MLSWVGEDDELRRVKTYQLGITKMEDSNNRKLMKSDHGILAL